MATINSEFIEKVDHICQLLEKMTQSEYKKYNYTPIKTTSTSAHTSKTANTSSATGIDRKTEMEIKQLQYQLKVQKKKNESPIEEEQGIRDDEKSKIELDQNNSFNTVANEEEYVEWRKLELSERIRLISLFLEEKEITDENIVKTILALVRDGRLTTKKEIVFDKINQKVINIMLLKKNSDDGYVLKSSEKKPNVKRETQKHLGKIFK